MPPMEFVDLLEELIPADTELYQVIGHLLQRKKAGEELDMEPRLSVVNDFIQQQIAYFEQRRPCFSIWRVAGISSWMICSALR